MMKKSFVVIMIVSAFALLLIVMAGLNGVSAQTGDYDVDNDGLIEITYLEQLDAIRWDLDGDGVADEGVSADGYRAAFPGAIAQMGCPQSGCRGYELARSLDFDDAASYASGSVNTSWTSGAGWLPIGLGRRQPFKSIFEGNDHAIIELFINLDGSDPGFAGLFGQNDNHIRNVALLGVDITAMSRVGGLVAFNYGDITSSYVNGSVTGIDSVGGLAGCNWGSITSSYTFAIVTGNSYVGGLVGFTDADSNISYSYAAGNLTARGSVSGGLVGYNQGEILSSYAIGNVSGNGIVGGLVGQNDADSNISSSYATGSVIGYDHVGGLAGDNRGNITFNYATGSVSGDTNVGGLVGYNENNITSSYSTGNVSGDSQVGGLTGYNWSGIIFSYSTGSVSGNTLVGGLAGGRYDNAIITASYWNTETSGQLRGVDEGSAKGVEGRTTAELQTPTGYTGIYAPWHLDFDNADGDSDPTTGRDDFWDFGTSSQYPALKVDFDGDGIATWQEFGNQHNRPEPIVTPVPTHTPTPVAEQDVLNRLSALEGLVATLQNRFSTSESLVTTLRDRLSASEAAVTALQNRVTALEGGTPPLQPTATPTPTPTATPTPRPGEPTPTPLPTATPNPPAELSPRAQEIDAAVKTYLEDAGEPATDAEIVSACRHLKGSHWDFFGLPLATPDRDYNIAAAIFLNTSGAFEIQRYCDEKQGI